MFRADRCHPPPVRKCVTKVRATITSEALPSTRASFIVIRFVRQTVATLGEERYSLSMLRVQIACMAFVLAAPLGTAQHFPPLDVDNPPNLKMVSGLSMCMTAKKDIANSPAQPLLTFHFTSPGATGVVLIDGIPLKIFHNEQDLVIHSHMPAGDHRFRLFLIHAAATTFISSNDDFKYCQPDYSQSQ